MPPILLLSMIALLSNIQDQVIELTTLSLSTSNSISNLASINKLSNNLIKLNSNSPPPPSTSDYESFTLVPLEVKDNSIKPLIFDLFRLRLMKRKGASSGGGGAKSGGSSSSSSSSKGSSSGSSSSGSSSSSSSSDSTVGKGVTPSTGTTSSTGTKSGTGTNTGLIPIVIYPYGIGGIYNTGGGTDSSSSSTNSANSTKSGNITQITSNQTSSSSQIKVNLVGVRYTILLIVPGVLLFLQFSLLW